MLNLCGLFFIVVSSREPQMCQSLRRYLLLLVFDSQKSQETENMTTIDQTAGSLCCKLIPITCSFLKSDKHFSDAGILPEKPLLTNRAKVHSNLGLWDFKRLTVVIPYKRDLLFPTIILLQFCKSISRDLKRLSQICGFSLLTGPCIEVRVYLATASTV